MAKPTPLPAPTPPSKPTYFLGTAGDDTVSYSITAKSNTNLDGGAGTDTLRLTFTAAEWARADIQADVTKFQSYLDAGGKGTGNKGDFFNFKAFKLDVSNFEKIVVVVDGVQILPKPSGVTLIGVDDQANTLTGGSGNDTLIGGNQVLNFQGSNMGNILDGGDGDDLLIGGNNLFGLSPFGGVATTMNGGAGNDTLISGSGAFVASQMTGGAGRDAFVLSALTSEYVSASQIMDFTAGEDMIKVAARPGVTPGATVTVVNLSSFEEVLAGQASTTPYFAYEQRGAAEEVGYLWYDGDGGTFDGQLIAVLLGVASLSASDISII